MNASSTIMTNRIRLSMAILCARNRRAAIRHGLRTCTEPTGSLGSILSTSVAGAAPSPCRDVSGSIMRTGMSRGALLIADPRVEYAVKKVSDQVEKDDRTSSDQQPCEHHVGVIVIQARLEQEVAHASPLVDVFGNDRTAKNGTDIEGGHRDEWDQGGA